MERLETKTGAAMTEVTVLMAVYNAEATLRRALDSLLQQTMAEWQVVCIDDASTDSSLAILREYAARDSRVEVVSLAQNGGQAQARNAGLPLAKGRYVTFLDADDWLSTDALAQVVDVFQAHPSTDCVLFSLQIVKDEAVMAYPQAPFDVLTGQEAFEKSLDWSIHGVYVARRELYESQPYDASCRSYSDDNTTRVHYYISREVRPCQGKYFYWQNPQSVTHAPSVRRYDYLRANESMRRCLESLGVGEATLRQYENVRWIVLVDLCLFHHLHARELPPDDRRYGLSELKRVWQTIDRRLLAPHITRRFGYLPMPSWSLFRLQEWLYFTLRGWLGKNEGK